MNLHQKRSSASLDRRRILIAANLGNALEWFDFVIYGYLSATFSQLFFPSANDITSTLLVLGTFAVGFVFRPIGSLLLGVYADRVGRKRALSCCIWFTFVGTLLIAFTPTYGTIGITAPLILVLARIMQGLGASGEFGSAVAMLRESAPEGRQNIYVSTQMSSTMVAILLAGSIGSTVVHFVGQEGLAAGWWRLPFLIGLLIGPVGLYIRRNIHETPQKQTKSKSSGMILDELFKNHRKNIMGAIGLGIIGTAGFYMLLGYMPTYTVKSLHLPLSAAFSATSLAAVIVALVAPVGGYLADRKLPVVKILQVCLCAVALISWPLLEWLLASPSLNRLLIVEAMICLPWGLIVGLIPSFYATIFPDEVRATGLGLSYNLTSTIFGGLSPVAVTWLISETGNKAAPALYLVVASVCGLMSLWWLSDRTRRASVSLS